MSASESRMRLHGGRPAVATLLQATTRRPAGRRDAVSYLSVFGRYALPYWWRIGLALLCGLGATAMDLARPWPLKVVVDRVLGPHHRHHGSSLENALVVLVRYDRHSLLLLCCGAILVIAALAAVLGFGQAYWMGTAGQQVIFDVRRALFAHVQRLSLSFHDGQRRGDLVARLTGDIQAIQALVVSGLLALVTNLLTLVGMIVIMVTIDWRFAAVALSVAPVLLYAARRYVARIKQATRLARKKEGEVTAVAQETLSAIRVVQAFAREEHEDARFARHSQESLEANLETTTLQAQFSRVVDLLVAVGTALIVYVGAQRVLDGQLSVGDLLIFISYLGLMYGPLRQLAKLSGTVSRATASAERIAEILAEEATIRDNPGAVAAPPLRGQVAFVNVSFGYERDQPVLQNISFVARPGETIALVGPTGAGKSTLVSLLLRFYDPTSGSVLLDGRDVRTLTLASLREQIAIVQQESVLFRTTIRENIAYGRPGATQDEIAEAARLANAHDFILQQPRGYDTVVGERGETLSGGQRQRIAIARAMLRGAPILILDEPTSALDAWSEQLTLEALERLRAGRTTFVIAHRLSTIRHADRILVLVGGRIAERGTHGELVALGGHYRRLLELQFGLTADASLRVHGQGQPGQRAHDGGGHAEPGMGMRGVPTALRAPRDFGSGVPGWEGARGEVASPPAIPSDGDAGPTGGVIQQRGRRSGPMPIGLRIVILAAVLSGAAALGASIVALVLGAFATDHQRPRITPRSAGITLHPPLAALVARAARLRAASIPPATATVLEAWAATASGDTYWRVHDHPGLTAGDNLIWACAIIGPMGRDARTGEQLVGCEEYDRAHGGGVGNGKVVLRLPRAGDRFGESLPSGANMVVWGTVMAPYRGSGAQAATPQIRVYFLASASHPAPAQR
jgi:ATP-binding cassette subfamily B protein